MGLKRRPMPQHLREGERPKGALPDILTQVVAKREFSTSGAIPHPALHDGWTHGKNPYLNYEVHKGQCGLVVGHHEASVVVVMFDAGQETVTVFASVENDLHVF